MTIIDTGSTANFISSDIVKVLHRNNNIFNLQEMKQSIRVNITNGFPL